MTLDKRFYLKLKIFVCHNAVVIPMNAVPVNAKFVGRVQHDVPRKHATSATLRV